MLQMISHKTINLLLTHVFIFCIQSTIFGNVWKVGPTHTYTLPSQVASLVKDGDIVEIDAGIYLSDVCRWTANNLIIRGIGGYAHLKSNGKSWGEKAIWVIQGNNTTIEWIEFSESTSKDRNGAGIRGEGLNLTIRYCYFHHNENGILAGNLTPCTYLIEHCEFAYNGHGDGYTHNLYINHIDTLIFRFNYAHHCNIGHELKSRARVNYILYNRISNEKAGTASREIDLPNGGTSIIMGNIIQQGEKGENSNLVGFGLEGLTNTSPHELYLINNTLVNNKGRGTYVAVKDGTHLYKGYNNIFAGKGTLLNGLPEKTDTSRNIVLEEIMNAGFTNSDFYDYHLSESATAIDYSSDPEPASNGFKLVPEFEYRHPVLKTARTLYDKVDAGAFEYHKSSRIKEADINQIQIVHQNNTLYILSDSEIHYVQLTDMNGRLILQETKSQLNLPPLPAGVYCLILRLKNGQWLIKKIKL